MPLTPKAPPGFSEQGFSDGAWMDVLQAVDKTYAELISYQDQLEAQNRELEGLRVFLASVLMSVSDALIVIGRDGTVEEASQSLDHLLDGGKSDALGHPLSRLVAPGSQETLAAEVATARSSRQPRMIEVELLTPEGPAPFEMSIAPRLDERGRSKGAVLTARPLGELRRTYAELAQSHRALQETQAHLVRNEKLASLGRLLAGVAHELNNPISFIYANAHALEKYAHRFETYFEQVQSGASRDDLIALRHELKLDRELRNLRSAIDGARDGAERVRDIVEDLRRLSAEGTGDMSRFDLAETARVAASWVQRGTKKDIAFHMDLDCPCQAYGRPGHVQQVIMNLVQNAVDAVQGRAGAQITITASHDGAASTVRVRDNGPGIPDDVAAKIFDPFFTTKDVGKGTGLGLSISHKIAEEHGGTLRLCERVTDGACFSLELPSEAPA